MQYLDKNNEENEPQLKLYNKKRPPGTISASDRRFFLLFCCNCYFVVAITLLLRFPRRNYCFVASTTISQLVLFRDNYFVAVIPLL